VLREGVVVDTKCYGVQYLLTADDATRRVRGGPDETIGLSCIGRDHTKLRALRLFLSKILVTVFHNVGSELLLRLVIHRVILITGKETLCQHISKTILKVRNSWDPFFLCVTIVKESLIRRSSNVGDPYLWPF
jgi:hypothetical protein